MTFIPIVFGSIVKQPSTRCRALRRGQHEAGRDSGPSQTIDASRHSCRRSTSRSCAAAPNGRFITPR